MQKLLTGLALALAVGAALVAGGVLASNSSTETVTLEARLDALERRLSRLETEDATRDPRRRGAPSLVGLARPDDAQAPGALAPGLGGPAAQLAEAAATDAALRTEAPASLQSAERIQALVDEAVEKKAAQIRLMEDKKPTIDVFTNTLALEREQQQIVEEEVLRGQLEIQSILETRADDGTNFMDEVVEVMADGIAHPGENPGRWQKLFGRLMSEEVPGTNETYAMRVDAVKDTVRQAFRRTFSDEQYATFEAWEMDPTEIQEVPSSPWKEVEARVIARARALGAEIPDATD